jgi:HlyD family secretion protein
MISLVVLLAAVAATIPGSSRRFRADELPATSDAPQASWDAVALGRVEPRSREIKIAAPGSARIAEVLVKANDNVFAGELLVRLDDEAAAARVAAADARVALSKRARNDQSTPAGSADRRKLEDAVSDSERTVVDAQAVLDRVAADLRAGSATQTDLNTARSALTGARDHLREQRDALTKLRAAHDTALPTRLEGELNVARAEWTLAQAQLEETRIRAPVASSVLQIDAKAGELAMPSLEPALLVLGDVSALRVRAEVEEQFLGRMRLGQHVVVRAAAFPGREFDGTVASVAHIVGPGRINARGARKFNDVDVLEAVVDLSDPGPLVVGEQVDVYFGAPHSAQQDSQ